MDTKIVMVMRWCQVRGGEVYGPLFKLRIGMHRHFPIGTYCCSVLGHPIVLRDLLVVTTGNLVEARKLHKNWFWMPGNEDG